MKMEDVLTPGLASFVVSCACATLGMMVSLSFMIFHVYHRNNRVVKMTSPVLNLLTSLGAVLLSISCFLFGLDFIVAGNLQGLSILCQTRVWLIACATSIMCGPVIAKSWRVYQIFKYGTVRRVVIKDSRLILISVCIVLIDIIIMLLWQVIDPVQMHQTSYIIQTQWPEHSHYSQNITVLLQECVCHRFPLWIALLSIWKLVLLIQALVLAWKIRNVSVPTLNDSSLTIMAIFGAVLMSFVALMVVSAFQFQPNVMYILSTILIAVCSSWVQAVLFLPKIRYWGKNSAEYSIRISSTTSIKDSTEGNEQDEKDANDDTPPTVNGDTRDENSNLYPDGIQEIVEENKALKQSLLEKQEYIGTLQKHLDITKEKINALPNEIEVTQDNNLNAENDHNNDNDIYETLRTPASIRRLDRSSVYRIDGLNSAEDTDFESLDDVEEHPRYRPKLNYCPSIRSYTSHRSFVEEFTDIRNSIAAELSTVQAINTGLKDSCEKDLRRSFSETEWLYEVKDADDLANSIAQSYDLDTNKETLTYLSSYIPRENNVYQVRSRKRSSSVVSINSSETFSQTSAEVENSNVSTDLSVSNRENATPNSQQHAAILRYYSYQHMNDKFNRYMAGRYNNMKQKYCPKLVLRDQAYTNGDVLGLQENDISKQGRWNPHTDSFV